MRHLRVLIAASDDLATELLTEVAAFDLPLPDITTLQPATALDDLETTVFTTGQAILRRLLEVAWEARDGALATSSIRSAIAAQVGGLDGYNTTDTPGSQDTPGRGDETERPIVSR